MRLSVIAVGALLAAGLPPPGRAHTMPNSTVIIEASAPGRIELAVAIPISELEAAAPGVISGDKARIQGFVREHVSVRGVDQRAWLGTLTRATRDDGDHALLKLSVRFTPSSGAASTPGQLHYDAIIDRIASHYVLVYSRDGSRLRPLVRLQAPDTSVDLDGRPRTSGGKVE